VLSLPKLIRPDFKHDRSLLTDLARWKSECIRELTAGLCGPSEAVRSGCVTALQLAGNLLNLNPHLH